MADLQDALRAIPGRQAYHLAVPGTASAAALSVVSFTATEKMGAPTEVRIVLTHPLQLLRADYLSRDASFSIVADDGTVHKFPVSSRACRPCRPRRTTRNTKPF